MCVCVCVCVCVCDSWGFFRGSWEILWAMNKDAGTINVARDTNCCYSRVGIANRHRGGRTFSRTICHSEGNLRAESDPGPNRKKWHRCQRRPNPFFASNSQTNTEETDRHGAVPSALLCVVICIVAGVAMATRPAGHNSTDTVSMVTR